MLCSLHDSCQEGRANKQRCRPSGRGMGGERGWNDFLEFKVASDAIATHAGVVLTTLQAAVVLPLHSHDGILPRLAFVDSSDEIENRQKQHQDQDAADQPALVRIQPIPEILPPSVKTSPRCRHLKRGDLSDRRGLRLPRRTEKRKGRARWPGIGGERGL